MMSLGRESGDPEVLPAPQGRRRSRGSFFRSPRADAEASRCTATRQPSGIDSSSGLFGAACLDGLASVAGLIVLAAST